MIPLSTARLLGCINGLQSTRHDRPHRFATANGLAFINHVGFHSHYDRETGMSTWPLPRGVSIDTLARFARRLNVLMTEPQGGDILLRAVPNTNRFDTTSIITEVGAVILMRGVSPGIRCKTIECTEEGNPYIGATVVYPADGDRFVRWLDLDPRNAAGNPTVALDVRKNQILLRRVA